MKKIIIACDSYKGCLTSKEVNEAMEEGVKGVKSEERSVKNFLDDSDLAEIISLEMSDGGEGMLDAFLSAMGGERVMIHAHDALMRWIDAAYGIAGTTAILRSTERCGCHDGGNARQTCREVCRPRDYGRGA